MAKFELKFRDITNECTIQVLKVDNYIQIQSIDFYGIIIIDLDKSTAIKFAKTLRTEINKITESEVDNG